MVRKRRDEQVKRLRRRDGEDLDALGQKSARWASDNLESLRSARPEMPSGLSDRAADAWEPLFAIADFSGGDWPRRARKASLALSGEHVNEDDNSAPCCSPTSAPYLGATTMSRPNAWLRRSRQAVPERRWSYTKGYKVAQFKDAFGALSL